jgi:galactitol-specific phosphotransferase system IIB component
VHDCSGDQSWGWSAENTTITSGDPAGCADGQATSASANSAVELSTTQNSDGTYAVHCPGDGDYYSFANFDSDELDHAEGKIEVDVYVATYADSCNFFWADYDGDNRIQLYTSSSGDASAIDIAAIYKGQATSQYIKVDVSDTFTTGEWLHVVYQWKTSESSADHKLTVSELNTSTRELSNTTSSGPEDELTSWASNADTWRIGTTGSSGGAEFYIDRIKIFKTSGL